MRFSSFVNTHVEQGGLDHFPQLLNLLLTPTNITVGHIRLLLHLQHQNKEWLILVELQKSTLQFFMQFE